MAPLPLWLRPGSAPAPVAEPVKLPDHPPIEAVAIAHPEPAPEPAPAVPPLAARPVEAVELAPLTPKPRPTHLAIVAPEPVDCTADEAWRQSEKSWADKLMNTYYGLSQETSQPPDAAALAALEKLKEQVRSADDDAKCASAHRGLKQWQARYISAGPRK